jgi:phosphatidylglycerol:prolipoprotein diacylglycerol transferase
MNRIAFTIFGTAVYWYGIMIALGVLAAFIVGVFLLRRRGYKADLAFEIILVVLPIGILGARLYFMITSGTHFSNFFDFRNGGMAIYGGVIAAAIALFIYTHFFKKCSFFAVADILVVCLIIAQSIGRWGNFFNTELYGPVTASHVFPFTVIGTDGLPHLALFFLESLLNFIGFFILLFIFMRQKKIGTASGVYLIFYGVVRAILEPLRESEFILWVGSLHVSVIVSIAAIVSGALILFLNHKGKISQNDSPLLKGGGQK